MKKLKLSARDQMILAINNNISLATIRNWIKGGDVFVAEDGKIYKQLVPRLKKRKSK